MRYCIVGKKEGQHAIPIRIKAAIKLTGRYGDQFIILSTDGKELKRNLQHFKPLH